MDTQRPPQEWIQASAERVTRAYQAANPTNPFTGNGRGVLFDGYIPSGRDPSITYHVVVTDRNSSCTCPANSKFNRLRDCSHIRAVKDTLSNA